MRENAGNLGFILGQSQEPTGDVDVTARQRESVDTLVVEDGETIRQVQQLGKRGQLLADVTDISAQLKLSVFTVELLKYLGVFFGADAKLLLQRHKSRKALFSSRRVSRTSGERQQR